VVGRGAGVAVAVSAGVGVAACLLHAARLASRHTAVQSLDTGLNLWYNRDK